MAFLSMTTLTDLSENARQLVAILDLDIVYLC